VAASVWVARGVLKLNDRGYAVLGCEREHWDIIAQAVIYQNDIAATIRQREAIATRWAVLDADGRVEYIVQQLQETYGLLGSTGFAYPVSSSDWGEHNKRLTSAVVRALLNRGVIR
jgi:23S rRNA C2498 (ribose-2'-O)-methylase RlmM